MALKTIWDSFSENYTGKVLSTIAFPEKRRAILESARWGRVLDLGCGPIDFLIRDLVEMPSVRVIASDFSMSMLSAVRRRISAPNLHFLAADNRLLPLRTSSLDTVISVNSILPEARHEVDAMFGEIRRVLRPGGRLVAVLPAFETSLMAKDNWGIPIDVDLDLHREYDTTGWQCFYTDTDIEHLMKQHDFRAFRIRRLYFDDPQEIAAIKKIYGDEIADETLLNHPLFEHLLVADA